MIAIEFRGMIACSTIANRRLHEGIRAQIQMANEHIMEKRGRILLLGIHTPVIPIPLVEEFSMNPATARATQMK